MYINPLKRSAETPLFQPASRRPLSELTSNTFNAQLKRDVGNSLLTEGVKLCKEKKFIEAIVRLDVVRRLYAEVISPSSKALCYRESGRACFELAKKSSLHDDFRFAIEYLTKASELDGNQDVRLLQEIHYNYGLALQNSSQYDGAVKQFEMSIRCIDLLGDSEGKTRLQKKEQQFVLEQKAKSFYCLGRVVLILKKYQEGIGHTSKALALFSRLDKPHPFTFKCKQNLAFAHLEVSRKNIATNSTNETIDLLNKAFSFFDKGDLSGGLDCSAVTLLNMLHVDLANALVKEKRFSEAVEHFEKANYYCDLLINEFRSEIDYNRYLIEKLNTSFAVGHNLCCNLKKWEEGIKKLNEAIELLERVDPNNPTLRKSKQSLAVIHHNFAQELLFDDKIEEAIFHYSKAISLYHSVDNLATCWSNLKRAIAKRWAQFPKAPGLPPAA